MKLERDLNAGESEFQRDWAHWRAQRQNINNLYSQRRCPRPETLLRVNNCLGSNMGVKQQDKP